MEKVTQDCVVSISYTLMDDDGNILDQSPEGEPLEYIQGYENIIPALENELNNLSVGDERNVRIESEEAYGPIVQEMIMKVDKTNFPADAEFEVGAEFEANSEEGEMIFRIIQVEGEEITVDGNHPLAGVDLNFQVKIEGIRAATAEEKEHGHVHGIGHDHEDEN